MFESNQTGVPLVRPLYFDYPEEILFRDNMESTYMLGDSLYVAPPVTSSSSYYSVFPVGKWVNIFNHADSKYVYYGSSSVKMMANDTYPNVYLKPGKIIPFQKNP